MLEIKELQKIFDNGFEALKGVSVTLEKGDLVCLLGPSGCGKTTILNIIAGLLDPTNGDILYEGESLVDKHPKDRNVGLVFQNYALYPHMTVLENVMFPLTVGNNKLPKEEAKKIAYEFMELTSITELANVRPSKMSGGQQQRVAITRALVQQPEILLLDEPLSNLDARLRLRIREEIRRLVKEIDITTIFVTHDQEEALSISDKIVLMDHGTIQQYDDPQNLYLEPVNLFVAQFIGNPNINILPIEITVDKIIGDSFEINLNELNDERIKQTLKPGSYQLGIRPEDLEVTSDSLFEAKVNLVELIGKERIITTTVGEVNAKSIVDIEKRIDYGETVGLNINTNKMFIFDLEGERVY